MIKPWNTKYILNKCDERNNLLKLIKQEPDPDKIISLRKDYKSLQNKITDEKRNSKKAQFTMDENQHILSDSQKIANIFNDHWYQSSTENSYQRRRF